MATTPYSCIDYIHLRRLYHTAQSGAQDDIQLSALSPGLRESLRQLVHALPAIDSSAYTWGETNATIAPSHLQQIIQRIAFYTFDHLSTTAKNFVAGRMYVHSDCPRTQDSEWGSHHAKDRDKVEALLCSLADNYLEECTAYTNSFFESTTDVDHRTALLQCLYSNPDLLLSTSPTDTATLRHCIMAIPAKERIPFITLLFSKGSHDVRMSAAACLEELSSPERQVFLKLIAPLQTARGNTACQQIITHIRRTPAEDRFDLMLLLCMIPYTERAYCLRNTQWMSPPEVREIVSFLQKIPCHCNIMFDSIIPIVRPLQENNRASIIKALRIIYTEHSDNTCGNGISIEQLKSRLVDRLSQVPHNLRLEVCNALVQSDPNHRRRLFLSNGFSALEQMVTYFPPQCYSEFIHILSGMLQEAFSEYTPFTALVLQNNPTLIASVHAHLMHQLCSSLDRIGIYTLAGTIRRNHNNLHLNPAHPLARMAENMYQWMRLPGNEPKCPYEIYQRLEFAARRPLPAFQPQGQKVGNDTLTLVPLTFQTKANLHNPITFAHLPPGIQPNTPAVLVNAFIARLNAMNPVQRQAVKNYIQESTTFSLNSLINNFNANFFRFQLATAGDPRNNIPAPPPNAPVPVIAARFFAIMRFILDQSPLVPPGQHLSPREEALLKMSASIQSCVTGKSEGITLAYDRLPKHYHYQTGIRRDTPAPATHLTIEERLDQDRVDRAEAYLNKEIQRLLTTLLSENNDLLQELIPTNPRVEGELIIRGDIAQLSHQATYLKNFVGRFVGLQHSVEFDPYTGVLHNDLLERTWARTLEMFYRHFTPKYLIEMLCETINRDLRDREHFPSLFLDLQQLANKDFAEVWNTDDEVGVLGDLIEQGAKVLLMQAGYLTQS